ncbi:hypothetical protein CGRA01v4_13596 [Colletotrichum graminicola]|nr:hypothetical protein CGRA01v4_13596 [Colletotrichum graminicola]
MSRLLPMPTNIAPDEHLAFSFSSSLSVPPSLSD